MREVFKAEKSKVLQFQIASVVGAILGIALAYTMSGKIPIFVIFITAAVAGLFVFLGFRLKKTPYLEVDEDMVIVNNIINGSRTELSKSQIGQASMKMNRLILIVQNHKEPIQIALGMLSKKDQEKIKVIFEAN